MPRSCSRYVNNDLHQQVYPGADFANNQDQETFATMQSYVEYLQQHGVTDIEK